MEKKFVPSVHRLALTVGGPVMTVLYLVGWLVFARMVPTPSPDWSAERLSQWLVNNKTGMEVGCLLMVAGCGLWSTWVAAISVWTFRTESRFPVLTFTQLVAGGAGTTFFIFDTLFWAVATFRAGETDPQITQAMWDIGWFGFLFTITVYIAWAMAWGLSILLNPPEHQVFPRWIAYITFGSVMCWSAGLFIIFFKGGPFSYGGLAAMWLPISEFFVWLVIIDVYARKAIRRQVELGRLEALELGDEYGVYPTPLPVTLHIDPPQEAANSGPGDVAAHPTSTEFAPTPVR
jgi:hypothetical protein